jgi:hypothetical protein
VESDAPPDIDEQERGDVVLLADSSVEGEDIASNLRTRGFVVFDVALGLLEARIASEAPRVVILDVDQPGALERAKRVRDVPHGADVEILCVGDPLRAAELSDVSLFDNVFERPVDVARLVERVTALAIPAGPGFAGRGTTPPPMYAPRPSVPPAPESVPPISEIPRGGGALEVSGLLDDSAEPAAALGLVTGLVRLSPELEQRMRDAEERVRADIDAIASSPEDEGEIDRVIDPELLALLDEPIDAIEDALGTGSSLDSLASGSSVGGTGTGSRLTPLPRPATSAGTGATGAGTGVVSAAVLTGTQAQTMAGDVLTSLPASTPPADPGSTNSPRAASPALGIRLGELFGVRAPTDRNPPTSAGGATPPRGIPRLPTPTQAQGFDPVVLRQLQQVVTDAIGAASLSGEAFDAPPVSPPVRFQEPRDIAAGRAVVDLHSGAPQIGSAAMPASGRVSPAAQSVPSAKVAPQLGASASAPASGPASVTGLAPMSATSRDTGSAVPVVFGEAGGLRPLARAIAARRSGSLALTTSAGVRRIVLQDGDVVTAGSEIADENLVAFLVARGDLDREAAAKLAGKLPPSGRHAGAALIAQGYLAQDDLWPVLRSHAEWLIGRAMTSGPGTVEVEDEPPGRLKAEPGVFGGATGAEVYVETARRVLSNETSLAALGGPEARFDTGARSNLVGECALTAAEAAVVGAAPGASVRDLAPDFAPEIVGVLRALTELEVLSVLSPLRREPTPKKDEPDPLDEEAVRKRVQARLALVREGDYFSLLGISKEATSYEIKRAYLALRRVFEPSRLLTAQTADLHDDVVLIVEVLDEAYDILRDGHRRERYRRAIEAGPPG